jgi:hypothetical protein
MWPFKPKQPPKKREMLGYRIVVQCQHSIEMSTSILTKDQADALAADLIEAGSTEWFCLDINKQLFVKPFMIVSFQIEEAWPRITPNLGWG